jgi:predicted dehydrogenase
MISGKIKFALIGCGYWGANFLRIISGSSLASLKYVCDTDTERLSALMRKFPNITFVSDIAEVIQDPEVQAVVVCTPVETHLPLTEMLLKSGKHVLCEKPLTATSDGCQYLYELAKQQQLKLLVGHVFEYNSVIRYMKSMITQGQIGHVHYLQLIRMGLGPVRKDVSVIFDLAAHDVAIAISMLGRMPVAVSATGVSYLKTELEDVAFIQLEFPDRVLASINVSWIDPIKQRLVKVVGEKKMLVFDDVSIGEKLKIIETGTNYQNNQGDFGSFQLSVKDGEIVIPNLHYPESLVCEFEHFADCIANNTEPLTNALYARQVVQVLEAAQASVRKGGQKIRID